MRRFALAACLLLTLSSCGGDDESSSGNGGSGGTGAVSSGGAGGNTGGAAGGGGSPGGTGGVAGGSTGGAAGGGGTAGTGAFALTSSAYGEGETIPQKYECTSGGGQSVSPPLAWTAGPAGTQSYAIVMRDLDFNSFVHWAMWDIPATTLSLPEGVEQVYQPSVPAGAKQAPFNGSVVGYYGPCSPSTVNTYEITVYALPEATLSGIDQTSTKTDAEAAIVAGALASAALSGES